MISINDAFNTVEFKNHYVIVPNSENYYLRINEYLKIKKMQKVKNDFSYNSSSNSKFLTVKELKKIIKDNIKDIEIK